LALNSPTGGGRSVGIVRMRTKATEFSLLQTYNLIGTVTFPTCKSKASTTAIDNIFITRTKNCIINPHINGLSDHEAQIIMVENIVLTKQINNITTNYTGIPITTKSRKLGRIFFGV